MIHDRVKSTLIREGAGGPRYDFEPLVQLGRALTQEEGEKSKPDSELDYIMNPARWGYPPSLATTYLLPSKSKTKR